MCGATGRKNKGSSRAVFRSGYFNGVIIYVCLSYSTIRTRAVPRLMRPGHLGRVRPSMGLVRYIQSRNYHFCTREPRSVLYDEFRLPYFIDFEPRIIVWIGNVRAMANRKYRGAYSFIFNVKLEFCNRK